MKSPHPKTRPLGALQLKILQVLWRSTEASVGDVQKALAAEDLAYTTIATMLRKMEAKGLVRHREDGRSFLYTAVLQPEEARETHSDHVLERLFGGNVVQLVQHLLTRRDVSPDELKTLEQLIANKRKAKK